MNDVDNRPIGIFDSGVGGLTVVKEVIKIMPEENIIYFGDTARVPYGSKSKELVYKFSCQIIRFLKQQNVKAIIIACNTVSSNCYDELIKQFHDIPIIEVISSGVTSAINTTKNNRIGVIGTEATIRSGKYAKSISDIVKAHVFSKSCPLFVPLAEEGFLDKKITMDIAKIYLEEFNNQLIDTLILGCTHYPLLIPSIEKVINENIIIVNPALETAKKMQLFLKENNLQNKGIGTYKFFVSDYSEKFQSICSMLIGCDYNSTEIDIEKF